MARPRRDGLLYFSFDTDFFYADRRIRALRARYGSDGLLFYIYLLTEIYRNGYYVRWDEDSRDNAIADLGFTEGLIEQVMTFLLNRSLLESILVKPDTIITSPGIQKRYQEAVKGLKRDVFVKEEIWLLTTEETASFIKLTKNDSFSENNPSKSEKNDGKSEKNHVNEMKRNETKRNKKKEKHSGDSSVAPGGTTAPSPAENIDPDSFEMKCVETIINSCLENFPKSKVPKTVEEKSKWAAEIGKMKRLDHLSEEEIVAALTYAVTDGFWKTNIRSAKKFREKFETLYLQASKKRQGSRTELFGLASKLNEMEKKYGEDV